MSDSDRMTRVTGWRVRFVLPHLAPLPEWQSSDTDAFAVGRDRGAFEERILALNAHRPDQIGLPLRVKALDTQQNHRRTPLSSHGKVCVKIVIQRYTHAFVVPSPFQNL